MELSSSNQDEETRQKELKAYKKKLLEEKKIYTEENLAKYTNTTPKDHTKD